MERSGKKQGSEVSSSQATKSREGATDLPIPPNLRAKLEAFQQRLWSVKIGEGALAGLLGLGISYLLVFILDRFIDTPTLLRYAILAVGFAVPAIGLPLRWYRWVKKQRTLEQVARLLKRDIRVSVTSFSALSNWLDHPQPVPAPPLSKQQ
ncbi:hypothetical protein N9E25_11440 [Verrucomicrobiales bacterium]|nr:hypothetical protein [Verrucomicrobiales bacterium]